MASSLEREGQVGRSSAAGAANHRRVWGAAGYTTRSSPAPTWPAARTAGLEVPRRTGKQGAGRGVFGNEAPPIWGGRPSPNSSSAGKCSRFQNSPGLLSPLLGLPGAPQPGSSLRGSGAGQAAEGGCGSGKRGPGSRTPGCRERPHLSPSAAAVWPGEQAGASARDPWPQGETWRARVWGDG